MIEKGSFFTPDKKGLLITEVQDELNKINTTLRNALGDRMSSKLTEIKDRLNNYLKELTQMKGVVTPSKTDEILDSISLSKKTRLETQYIFGLQSSTIWLLLIVGVSVGIFYNYKKNKK
jgi:isocitrate dehydrogenase